MGGKLAKVRAVISKLKIAWKTKLALHWSCGLVTLKFHLLCDLLNALKRSGGLPFAGGAPFEHFNVLKKNL